MRGRLTGILKLKESSDALEQLDEGTCKCRGYVSVVCFQVHFLVFIPLKCTADLCTYHVKEIGSKTLSGESLFRKGFTPVRTVGKVRLRPVSAFISHLDTGLCSNRGFSSSLRVSIAWPGCRSSIHCAVTKKAAKLRPPTLSTTA